MNYLQVKVVTQILEDKIKFLNECKHIKHFDKGYCEEDIKRLEDFIKEIQTENINKKNI